MTFSNKAIRPTSLALAAALLTSIGCLDRAPALTAPEPLGPPATAVNTNCKDGCLFLNGSQDAMNEILSTTADSIGTTIEIARYVFRAGDETPVHLEAKPVGDDLKGIRVLYEVRQNGKMIGGAITLGELVSRRTILFLPPGGLDTLVYHLVRVGAQQS